MDLVQIKKPTAVSYRQDRHARRLEFVDDPVPLVDNLADFSTAHLPHDAPFPGKPLVKTLPMSRRCWRPIRPTPGICWHRPSSGRRTRPVSSSRGRARTSRATLAGPGIQRESVGLRCGLHTAWDGVVCLSASPEEPVGVPLGRRRRHLERPDRPCVHRWCDDRGGPYWMCPFRDIGHRLKMPGNPESRSCCLAFFRPNFAQVDNASRPPANIGPIRSYLMTAI